MGFDNVIRATTDALGVAGFKLSEEMTKVLVKARTGKLKYDDLVTSWGVLATRWIDVWLAFMKPAFGPLLPVVIITWKARDVPGQSPAGIASLEDPVPQGAMLTATSLVFVGDPDAGAAQPTGVAPLPVDPPQVLGDEHDQVKVSIHVPGSAPAPPTGLYEGCVMLKGTPVATVLVRLAP
jgi:hypothetical protein